VIISATTVKDSRDNVEKFVRRNLLGGIDHIVLFLDAPMPEVEEFLDTQPDVTYVRAHGDWWGDLDPGGLNERQINNASVVSRLAAGFGWAEWMFVLDGDEVARIDRGVLERLDPQVRAVRLLPLEVVSSLRPEGDPTLFKRLLSDDELHLLHVLGVIDKPVQRAYFRGHMTGKPGIRPSADLALGVHHAIDTTTGERVRSVTDPGLRLLHYESYSGAEFVRKWIAMLSSGDDVSRHKNRAPVAQAVAAVLALGLPEAETAELLEDLYVRTALDDVDTLSRLRLLVEIHPDDGERRPRPPESELGQLRALLASAYDAPKGVFRPRARDPKAAKVIRRIQRAAGR